MVNAKEQNFGVSFLSSGTLSLILMHSLWTEITCNVDYESDIKYWSTKNRLVEKRLDVLEIYFFKHLVSLPLVDGNLKLKNKLRLREP